MLAVSRDVSSYGRVPLVSLWSLSYLFVHRSSSHRTPDAVSVSPEVQRPLGDARTVHVGTMHTPSQERIRITESGARACRQQGRFSAYRGAGREGGGQQWEEGGMQRLANRHVEMTLLAT